MIEAIATDSVLANSALSAPTQAASTNAPSFTETVGAAFQDAMNTVSQAESASIAGARGEASIHETVHAVMNAELTVQAVTAVRDRAVQAYQDLIRMPI